MQALVDLVQRSGISELTIKQGDSRITLKKSVGSEVATYSTGDITESSTSDGSYEVATFRYPQHSVQPEADVEREEVPVTSPLVGVFHHVKPIVGPGARVKAGQVVAVIEAMKLITEVTTPTDGAVVETFVEDGMAVEYGQPLMLVNPSGYL